MNARKPSLRSNLRLVNKCIIINKKIYQPILFSKEVSVYLIILLSLCRYKYTNIGQQTTVKVSLFCCQMLTQSFLLKGPKYPNKPFLKNI